MKYIGGGVDKLITWMTPCKHNSKIHTWKAVELYPIPIFHSTYSPGIRLSGFIIGFSTHVIKLAARGHGAVPSL